ncbi:hypothetical protein EJ08DRAFT_700894 [Tothia fuscella]|uniref:4'-phosphopantetheinyl transferase domain-containing protein n=1 Tax=Tothia fuscella TaxID=1048955 RepID=A0A9P4NJK2_9PEZI|nr:hypothetical protein EJ08DRAFT_700894 [Tothia fuscella]
MPIRPFPSPYRIGTDICHIPRIHNIITKGELLPITNSQTALQFNSNFGHFLRRLLTPYERRIFWAQSIRSKRDIRQVAEHLAGRWAAKEAIIKAIPRKTILRQIIVLHPATTAVILDDNCVDYTRNYKEKSSFEGDNVAADDDVKAERYRGRPFISLKDHYSSLRGQECRLSISHDGDYATAVAITHNEPEERIGIDGVEFGRGEDEVEEQDGLTKSITQ